MQFDPVLYAKLCETALANHDAFENGESLMFAQMRHTIGAKSIIITMYLQADAGANDNTTGDQA